MPGTRSVRRAAALGLAAAVGCGCASDGSEPTADDSANVLEVALAYAPADVSSMEVVDVDLLSQGRDQETYAGSVPDWVGAIGTVESVFSLADYEELHPAWDIEQVEWGAAVGIVPGTSAAGYALVRLRESVDLRAVLRGYEELGYVRRDRGARVDLSLPRGPALTLFPAERLIAADMPRALTEVVTGDAPSALDAGTFEGMTAAGIGAEAATAEVGTGLGCEPSARDDPTAEGLEEPERYVHAVVDAEDRTAVTTALRFSDASAAEADAEARAVYLEQGESSGVVEVPESIDQPFGELFDVEAVTVDGAVVTVGATYPAGASGIGGFYGDGCLPFTASPKGPSRGR